MMEETIHVAIVEDDDDIRKTLQLIIDGTPGFHCKHIYENGELAAQSLLDTYVQVVLMDIEMPKMNGIEAVKTMKPQRPDLDFIMLTIRQDDEAIFQSMCAGASGYLMKDTPPSDLLKAIKDVRQGGAPMSANIARRVIQSFHPKVKSPLTTRETEILQLLAKGMNYKVVAKELFLSPHTVKSHIKNIYSKLQVNSRAEAIRKAIEDKLL
jgi:DNA-binding NarL/FixJ family response regulator